MVPKLNLVERLYELFLHLMLVYKHLSASPTYLVVFLDFLVNKNQNFNIISKNKRYYQLD